ncbi:alkaline phosphatase family protein [Solirubrobacter sp. CPCC 204708]|uniref:Alkaline phosphatase family protein n=1 Tax=Solirubrobacter deserti TaxID=2282478 RepID=A0ABT4RBH2_9ACTN|nr:alkaline phosphatase family protein [Solirubrobacter deserti]MBE2317219.1 alkaline phosphatase family protein [Solirubrobacter deserti]MDA0135888.1 alkaline phosphatase family protein [Solirubrobacter deserti]
MTGFADLPARIDALAAEHDQLAVVLLDAFGWAFVQRHGDHPLLRRLEITPASSQFPSTTTAHLTTLYSGLPVTEHGLYEWRCYEPLVGDVIRPLRFALGASNDPLPITPQELFPWPSRCAGATVLQPAPIADTPYGSAAFAGATVRGFDTFEEAVGLLGELPGVTYLYWDAIDATGHREGPSSEAFVQQSLRALDALAKVRTPMLVTADHGQLDVHTTDHLDLFWSELPRHLTRPPAGSARDLFLHVDDPELVITELSARLEHRAQVRRADELFDHIGPRLRERLADVCVLPAPGRMAALTGFPSAEQRFKGHHGGLTPEESQTWIGFQA